MPGRGKVYVKDLRVGDVVDLEGDEYADPDHDVVDYVYEYQVVGSIEIEAREGEVHVVVFEDDHVVAFPPLHEILTVPTGGFGGRRL